MNLNITNLLNTLQNYYDPEKNSGERYTGSESGIENLITTYGLSGSAVTNVELTSENLTKSIIESGTKITVSSLNENKFSYKIDSESGKIIIFGNNLTIQVDEENSDLIEVVGISNIINATSKEDKITLFGYDNEINADDGEDKITVYGEDNIIKDSEVNIFNGVGGNTLIVDDKEFKVSVNKSLGDSTPDMITLKSSVNSDGEIVFETDKADITAIGEDNTADNIILKGNKNRLDTSVGDDNITITGSENIITSGEGEDKININGKNNEINGDNEDIVYYTETYGQIKISAADDSSHYIKVADSDGIIHEYFVERRKGCTDDVSLTYELTASGVFEFYGHNFSIKEVQDGVKDKIKITGHNNYVDTGDEDDEITVIGNRNVVTAGDGDDSVSAAGINNELYGDDGNDSVMISNDNNTTDSFEDSIVGVILNSENQAQTITTVDGKKYTIELSKAALSSDKQVSVKYNFEEDGSISIEADDVIIYAVKGQEDKINFSGNRSKIYAGDKNDEITVTGDDNFIDGWSGDDKITATGINNKVYGFLGDDEINIIQRELTDAQKAEAFENISDTDEDGNKLTDEQKLEIANKNNANKVDGEYGTDTVKSNSVYTNVSVDTEIYKSLSQSIKLNPKEDEKKIVVTDNDGREYSYTIKNYATEINNNPFVSTRTISYDIVDVTVDGKTTKQLVVKGDYISVIADNGQNDNVKIIGNNNYLDLGDGEDSLYAEGNYNMLFGGISADFISVKGDNNDVYGDSLADMQDKNDSDTIIVEGSGNMVSGSRGDDNITLIGDSFKAFGGDGDDKFSVNAINSEIFGGKMTGASGNDEISINDDSSNKYYDFSNASMKEDENMFVLSPDNLKKDIIFTDVDGEEVVFNIEPNILLPEELAGEIYIRYSIEDVTIDGETRKQLVINGSNIMINLTKGSDKSVNVKLLGNDLRFESFGGDDVINVEGDRNLILSGSGENIINVSGSYNQIQGGAKVDTINVNGSNNDIIGGGSKDNITVIGYNNNTRYNIGDNRDGGSLLLSEANTVQTIVMNNRAYEISIYGIDAKDLETTEINVRYSFDNDGYMVFEADNIKIRVIDEKETLATDEKTIDNKDSIKLIGNNCYISGSNGDDVLIVEGHNNTIVGWYGDDSVHVIGDNNEIGGFDGNDIINIDGSNNIINGEQGIDTLYLNSGENNKYTNIEEVNRK